MIAGRRGTYNVVVGDLFLPWRTGEVVLDWRKTNTKAHDLLVIRLKQAMR